MANFFDQFDEPAAPAAPATPSSGNFFDQFDEAAQGSVRSGDVAARQAQANAPGNFPAPTRSPTIAGEFAGGLKDIGGSFSAIGKPSESILETPAAKLGLGAVRTGGAILAPLDALASSQGAKVQDALLGMGVNPTLAAALATYADLSIGFGVPEGIARGAGAIAPAIKALLPLNKERIAALKSERAAAEAAPAAGVRELVPESAPNAKEAGKQFVAAQEAGHAASKKQFNKLYGDLIEEGKGISTSGEAITSQAEKTLAEKGLAGTPGATRGERSAEKLKSALEVEDEAAKAMEKLPSNFGDYAPNSQKQMLEKLGIDMDALASKTAEAQAGATNLGDLVLERQRLKGAARGAYQSGNYNLARQLDDLTNSTMLEIERANPSFAAKLEGIDAKYATEHAPYYAAGASPEQAVRLSRKNETTANIVDNIMRPASDASAAKKATRAAELLQRTSPVAHEALKDSFLKTGVDAALKTKKPVESLQNWWARYENVKDNDEALKAFMGDRYKPTKDFMASLAEKNASSQAVVDKINSKLALLEKSKDLTHAQSERIGTVSLLHGAVGLISAGAAGGALATGHLLTGGMIFFAGPALFKLLQSARGAQVLARLSRAAPGTSQAAAFARQAQNILRELPRDQQQGNEY